MIGSSSEITLSSLIRVMLILFTHGSGVALTIAANRMDEKPIQAQIICSTISRGTVLHICTGHISTIANYRPTTITTTKWKTRLLQKPARILNSLANNFLQL